MHKYKQQNWHSELSTASQTPREYDLFLESENYFGNCELKILVSDDFVKHVF